MSTNRHASIRYQVLDKLLQKESEDNTLDNLRHQCTDAIADEDYYYGTDIISIRTFRDDIAHIKRIAEKSDVDVLHKRGSKGYYYCYSRRDFSIFKNELSDSEVGQLKCAMQLLSRFKGLPEYNSIAGLAAKLEKKYGITNGDEVLVEYEHIESIGEEIMADICNCIINKQPIKITYMPYGKPEKKWIIHPYYLKEFNNRWFLFGYNETEHKISNVALDRIRPDFEPVPNVFIPNTFVDFSIYFDNIIGVTVRDSEPITITLKASEERYPYIESKPIHPTQQLTDAAKREFTIRVIPNLELDALILSFGKDLEVVSPSIYRHRIEKILNEAIRNYDET